jgi:hypothetical protein
MGGDGDEDGSSNHQYGDSIHKATQENPDGLHQNNDHPLVYRPTLDHVLDQLRGADALIDGGKADRREDDPHEHGNRLKALEGDSVKNFKAKPTVYTRGDDGAQGAH